MWDWHDEEEPVVDLLTSLTHLEVDTDDEVKNVPIKDELSIGGLDHTRVLDAYRCIVCNTVPFTEIFECRQGHFICAGCYQMRVLDKMLGSQLGTCPQCGVRIYRHQPIRNGTGEHTLANVLTSCEKCGVRLNRIQIRHHSIFDCPIRTVTCKYKRIGCNWKGTMGIPLEAHEENCEYRHKTGLELFEELRRIQDKRDAKQLLINNIMKLLQLPQITARWLHLLPHTDPFPRNSFVFGPMFQAFGQRWIVRFKCETPNNSVESDIEPTGNCFLTFQLCLQPCEFMPRSAPLGLTYSMFGSVYSDVRFQPNLCEKNDFTSDNSVGPSALLYENTWQNLSVLLNERGFYARLMMARI